MRCSNAITKSAWCIALAATFCLAASAQSRLARATVSFPTVLDGGSVGVPSNLRGTIYAFDNRIVFEAFPEVENVTLPCETIKEAKLTRWNAHVLKIVSAASTYRFDLRSPEQAQRFLAAVASSCEDVIGHYQIGVGHAVK